MYMCCTESLLTGAVPSVYLAKGSICMVDQNRAYVAKTSVRTMIADDGCILLNVESGRFYSTDGLGAQIWSQLIQQNTPLTLNQLASRLCADTPEIAIHEIRVFLETIQSAGFISVADTEYSESQNPQRMAILSGRTRAYMTGIAVFCVSALLKAGRITQVLTAYLAIATADLIIRLGGFRALHQAVRNWPVSSYKAAGRLAPEQILSAVDKASAFYRRKARCLQRSCSAVWLLRAAGMPARLIIGCRKLPFLAHAWVEIDNQVVGDSPLIKNLCTPMDCV